MFSLFSSYATRKMSRTTNKIVKKSSFYYMLTSRDHEMCLLLAILVQHVCLLQPVSNVWFLQMKIYSLVFTTMRPPPRQTFQHDRVRLFLVFLRLVFSWFFDFWWNLGYAQEDPTRKTCFSREMNRLVLCIYLAKCRRVEFLWFQQSLCCIFMRNRR